MGKAQKKKCYKNPYLWTAVATIAAAIIGAYIARPPKQPTPPPPPPDFTMKITPMNGSTQQGGTTSSIVVIEGTNEYDNTVSLSVENEPDGVIVSFNPTSGKASPEFTSDINFTVGKEVPVGDYEMTIRGAGDTGIEHKCTYNLKVEKHEQEPPDDVTEGTGEGETEPESPVIEITDPEDRSVFPLDTLHPVRGTAKNVPESSSVWIVVMAPDNRYYPNDSLKDPDGPWSKTIKMGSSFNIGEDFFIIAVLADEDATGILQRYRNSCNSSGKWPGMESLPEGAKVVKKIMVTGKSPD